MNNIEKQGKLSYSLIEDKERFLIVLMLAALCILPILSSCGTSTNLPLKSNLHYIGEYTFDAPIIDKLIPEGLSGIAAINENKFIAVSDRHAAIFILDIEVDLETGEITFATLVESNALRDNQGNRFSEIFNGADREGIVYIEANNEFCISNERLGNDVLKPTIECYDFNTKNQTDLITPSSYPSLLVFNSIRKNQGFESLAYSLVSKELWTANEDSLKAEIWDTEESQSRYVRLQKFNEEKMPEGQFLYPLEPLENEILYPERLSDLDINGLVDLLFLPDGTLISLERALVGDRNNEAKLRISIFEVTTKNAIDISSQTEVGKHSDITKMAVSKKSLFKFYNMPNFNFGNIEGMALGPKLLNGDYSVILIADNDTGTKQTLHSLRIKLEH